MTTVKRTQQKKTTNCKMTRDKKMETIINERYHQVMDQVALERSYLEKKRK
ncbi:hypothetical protein FHS70_000328 [Flammeovirga yaeyamensis]|nr:hypothetical protein [Flammeovirga yaeyamensis]